MEIRADERECFDPECFGIAEPEVDGEYRYYECQDCGSTFGFTKVQVAADACAVGIPEETRRVASAPMEEAMMDEFRKKVPLIQIGRKPQ